jgi:putative membrane protein
MDSLAALKTTLLEIDGLASQVMGGMGALTQALYQPQDDPSNPKTLANAIIALSTGADSLADGASDLKQGLGALRGASSQIGNAIDAFDTASGELSTQTGALDQGMGDFVEEGMSKLDDPERKAEFDKALAIKDEMVAQSQAYASYSGAQEGVKTHWKLVYKIESPQAPVAAHSQAADRPQDVQQPTTFWQRILQLFR